MRKIIGPKGETAKVPSVRVERLAGNEDSSEVRRVLGDDVGVLVRGAKKVIIRPRLKTDPPGLVPYIIISGEHYTSGDAWKDARGRL
jgi:hypothetical protein